MKKIISYLKRLFSNKPILEERYTLNKMYQDNAELKRFIQKRQKTIVLEWNNFPADQYGKAELVQNNKVIESAKLMKGKHDLIYWQFYEQEYNLHHRCSALQRQSVSYKG